LFFLNTFFSLGGGKKEKEAFSNEGPDMKKERDDFALRLLLLRLIQSSKHKPPIFTQKKIQNTLETLFD
jgi:hypothetical protein